MKVFLKDDFRCEEVGKISAVSLNIEKTFRPSI